MLITQPLIAALLEQLAFTCYDVQSLSLHAAPACCLLKICFIVSIGVDTKVSHKTTISPTFLCPLLFKEKESWCLPLLKRSVILCLA